jgi:hypothetical protein
MQAAGIFVNYASSLLATPLFSEVNQPRRARMAQAGINFVKYYPDQFFAYLKAQDYPVYHKSNFFFRDFQYGLWKFLTENRTKISYADVEKMAHDVVDEFEKQGLLRKINRQSFELNLPPFQTNFPTQGFGPAPTAPPAAKGKAAAKPAAAPAAAAAGAAAPGAAATAASPAAASSGGADVIARGTNLTQVAAAVAALGPDGKQQRIQDVQRRIAEAKARRLAGG